MKLKEYMKMENKIDRLTQFFDDNGQWQVEYMENDDFKYNYDYVLYDSEIYHGELESETSQCIKYLESINESNSIYDYTEIETTNGIYRRSNEIASFNLGEIEVQITRLWDPDSKTKCIYSELIKGMTQDDIKEAKNNSEYYISGEYLYIDCSYDRVSLILNENDFLDFFKKEYPKKYNEILKREAA